VSEDTVSDFSANDSPANDYSADGSSGSDDYSVDSSSGSDDSWTDGSSGSDDGGSWSFAASDDSDQSPLSLAAFGTGWTWFVLGLISLMALFIWLSQPR
jgi:hypothetical protein